MSSAFVRENDDNGMLNQVTPTINGLTHYLKQQNNGKHIFVKKIVKDNNGLEQHFMSDGFVYVINSSNNWEMIL